MQVIRTFQNRFSAMAAILLTVIVLVMPRPQPALAEDLSYRRLVILGDPHLPGRLIEKKEAVRETINSWEDVEMVIAVGDICSDWGSDEEYHLAKEFFSKLRKPFFPIAGNHDYIYDTPAGSEGGLVVAPRHVQEAKLKKFRETFNLPGYFYAKPVGNYHLIFLSSDHVDFLSGMSERQLAWFRSELEDNKKTPTIIIFHGPLKGTLTDYRRWINTPGFIAQPHEEVRDIIKQNPQVFLWVSGHTHTPPMEESFASPVNVYEGQVTNIHNKDMNRGDIWTNSLFLYPDKVVVKTWDHQINGWLPHLERTIALPKL
ncbi:MAG: metallophosphoesterase [Desulfobacula sp.]|jgi:predicted phosphodiesterase